MRLLPLAILFLSLPPVAGIGILSSQRQIAIKAYPVEGIEYSPLPVMHLVAARGTEREASIEITNRRAEPLEIVGLENPSKRFTARVETLEKGQRYRLVVILKGEGPAGRQRDVVELITTLADAPSLRIPVNTLVREKVYTFPDTVFMGRYPLSEIQGKTGMASSRAQILMVYRKGTTGFEIKVTSDIPFLKINSEQGPKGDRWENTIWFDPEKATAGEIQGKIFIETNDPDMPRLEVPVWGDLQPR